MWFIVALRFKQYENYRERVAWLSPTQLAAYERLCKKEDTKWWCHMCHTEKLGSVQILSATVNETEAAKGKVTRNEESLNMECHVRIKRSSCLGFVKKPGWIHLQRGEVPECDNRRFRFVGVLVVTGFIVILGAWLKWATAKKRIPWIM